MKKNISPLILSFLFLIVSACSEQATDPPDNQSTSKWEKVSDLPGSVRKVQVVDNIIYASVASQNNTFFCKSADKGLTWETRQIDQIIHDQHSTLLVNGDNAYIGSFGLYTSNDRGQNWLRNTNLDSLAGSKQFILNCISVLGDKIYLGHSFPNRPDPIRGVMISTDNGNNWYSPQMPKYYVYDMIAFETHIIFTMFKVYITTDNFNTFYEASGDWANYRDINKIVNVGIRIFAVDSENIYYSDNGGTFWLRGNHGFPSFNDNYHFVAHTFAHNEEYVFICRSNGVIYYSKISEIDWKVFDSELPERSYIQLLFTVDNYLYYSANLGVWRAKISE
ncbi:MAG TPA: hypothetical protein VLH59_12200 [Ignavibacteriaceae bacterium]|nr:hypothetical protein [Ignavibacteriaceae bacterium]